VNYYVVLGIPTDADNLVIRSAFRSLARRYHPDAGEESSPDMFRLVVEAYETLSDPIRRKAYDLSIRPNALPARIVPEPITAPIVPRVSWSRYPVPLDPAWAIFDQFWDSIENDFFFSFFPRRW
jgi:curved DNA-binding protein CbpA